MTPEKANVTHQKGNRYKAHASDDIIIIIHRIQIEVCIIQYRDAR